MTRRDRNLARLNEERLKEVFAVLVANCGAASEDEERFLDDFSYNLKRYSSAAGCWRFDGYIDDGGFYFFEDGLPTLACAFGELDQETRRMLIGVNRIFVAMTERWRIEDRRARARERRAQARAIQQAEREARRRVAAPRERLSLLAR